MWALLLLACTEPARVASPESGSMSGYARIAFDLEGSAVDVAAIEAVWLGSNPVLELEVVGSELTFLDQGAPVAGPVPLVVQSAGIEHRFEDAYTYDAPADPVFERFYAVGASLTQGVQGGVPTYHGQRYAPSAQVARQVGAYHPLPLLRPGLFPELRGGDIGPPPDCQGPTATELAMGSAFEVLGALSDPETGDFGFQYGRLDPDIAPQNLAIGGLDLAGVIDGTGSSGIDFVAHLMLDPYGPIDAPVPESQLQILADADPTVVMCTDTFGNDVIGAFVSSDVLSLDAITPAAQMSDDIDRFTEALAASGAQVFVANLPRPSLLPATDALRRRAIEQARQNALAAGEDPDAAATTTGIEQDALIASVDAVMDDYNAMLEAAADRYDNVHVVRVAERVEQITVDGIGVGDDILGVGRFSGLLGTDGLHFSDTGYAMLANAFLDTMQAELGTTVPPVDLEAVYAQDPWAPAVLIDEGLDPACVAGPPAR